MQRELGGWCFFLSRSTAERGVRKGLAKAHTTCTCTFFVSCNLLVAPPLLESR